MASIRILKKTINQSLAIFIDDCYEKRAESKQSDVYEQLVDKAIVLFDVLIESINSKAKGATAAHFKKVEDKLRVELEKLYMELEAF